MGGPSVTLDFSKAQPIPGSSGSASVTLDFSKAQPLSASPPAAQATVSAAPGSMPGDSLGSKLVNWARNVQNDLKYGTDTTGVGHVLKALGAHGLESGNSEAVGDFMGSLPLGLMRMVEGEGNVFSGQPRQGAENLAGGALQAATIPASFVAPESAEATLTALAEIPAGAKRTAMAVASKTVPSLVDGPPESMLTRAIKPGKNNVGWNTDLKTAMPLMKSAEEGIGHEIAGVDDALDAANLAKQEIWEQYKARLGPAAQMGATIDGNKIADAMIQSIGPRVRAQNPALVQRVTAQANTYRRPLTVQQAEELLSGKDGVNNDLQTYYAKNKVGRRAAEADPEMSATIAEGDALRNALYNKLDAVSGPGAAQLKKAYGALSNVEKELRGRQLVAARQNPESLSEQLSTVRGAGRIAKGIVTVNPGDVLEGMQNITVSRALKARNTSDAMIARAFKKTPFAQPFPSSAAYSRFMPPGRILPRGAMQTPIPEGSPTPFSAPPPVSTTTRAQRLGLLLPDQTGGPIELPYVPEMTSGEKLAALMQLLRKAPQGALPAKASAIRLGSPK